MENSEFVPYAPGPYAPSENEVDTVRGRAAVSLVYLCYLFGFALAMIPNLVGLFIAYGHRSSGDPLTSTHARFQVNTFWYSVVYGIIGIVLIVMETNHLVETSATFSHGGWIIAPFGMIAVAFIAYGFFWLRSLIGFFYFTRNAPYPRPRSFWFW